MILSSLTSIETLLSEECLIIIFFSCDVLFLCYFDVIYIFVSAFSLVVRCRQFRRCIRVVEIVDAAFFVDAFSSWIADDDCEAASTTNNNRPHTTTKNKENKEKKQQYKN